MKEQTRHKEVQINEEEICKLPEKEFIIMIVKMTKNIENRMEEIQESINKDIEELKDNIQRQTTQLLKLKILQKESIAEYLKQMNKSASSELEDKMVKINSEEENKVKIMKRTEDSLRGLWDNIKCTNIQIIGIPEEEEEKKKVYEEIF